MPGLRPFSFSAGERKIMNHFFENCGGGRDATSKTVTPECFNRGSSPNFAWIPAKSMRE
jgi:hypothetical protein